MSVGPITLSWRVLTPLTSGEPEMYTSVWPSSRARPVAPVSSDRCRTSSSRASRSSLVGVPDRLSVAMRRL
jgi:hypothetical protein